MLDRPSSAANSVVPFGTLPKEDDTNNGAHTERCGQAIVALLKEAADLSRVTCERAIDKAHQLSIKLQAAEDLIRELESESKQYQLRATQAEKWLLRIHQEIEERFFGPKAAPAAQSVPRNSNSK